MILQWAFKFKGPLDDRRTWHLKGCVLKIKDDISYMQGAYRVLYIYYCGRLLGGDWRFSLQ
jgi:hypothetical protein